MGQVPCAHAHVVPPQAARQKLSSESEAMFPAPQVRGRARSGPGVPGLQNLLMPQPAGNSRVEGGSDCL